MTLSRGRSFSLGEQQATRMNLFVQLSGVPYLDGVRYLLLDVTAESGAVFLEGYLASEMRILSIPASRAERITLLADAGDRAGVVIESELPLETDVTISLDGGSGGTNGDPAEISDTIMTRYADGAVEPVAREVVAVQRGDGDWRVVGSARSESDTGTYTLTGLVDPGSEVFLMALDDLGEAYQASGTATVGDLIHPTTPNGYVYRVVTGGELPATEPDWWTTGQQQVGTATLEAREYLRPLAHGPVDVTFL